MEYEIEDGEERLFDRSTNPSLLHDKPWKSPVPRRRAVFIPEEETQPS